MKKLKLIITIAVCSIFIQSVWAAGLENILVLTVVNNTKDVLTYSKIDPINPTNKYTITPQIIVPGGKTTIVAQTSDREDLWAGIHFTDSMGRDNVLFILDPLRFNEKIVSFKMMTPRFNSSFKVMPNKEQGNFLMTKEAEVTIVPSSGHLD